MSGVSAAGRTNWVAQDCEMPCYVANAAMLGAVIDTSASRSAHVM
ncbi:hypothetical protein AAFN86_21335 [Roseomonas sp. CAU 1739]